MPVLSRVVGEGMPHRPMTVSKADLLELVALNEASGAFAATSRCALPPGFSAPVAIRMPAEGRPCLIKDDPLDIWGFVTTRARVAYIVFRGTQFTSGIEFLQEWATDAFALPL